MNAFFQLLANAAVASVSIHDTGTVRELVVQPALVVSAPFQASALRPTLALRPSEAQAASPEVCYWRSYCTPWGCEYQWVCYG